MPRADLPTVRIFPMSDRAPGFVGLSIEQVQRRFFLRDLAKNGGRWRYAKTGLSAAAGTVVLFQFKARVIASAKFLYDERYGTPRGGHCGELRFDPKTIRTFDPVDANSMRRAWAGFRAFGHVKQRLNPGSYPAFKRRLRNVVAPVDAT